MARKPRRQFKKKATLFDVARHAGVSHITVSRAMSPDSQVKTETRVRVLASAQELGYAPNTDARQLANIASFKIGFVYGAPTAQYIDQLLAGTLAQARKMGCQVTVRNCLKPGLERQVISELVRDGVAGIILPAPLCDSDEALAALSLQRTPSILVGSGRPAPGFSAVSIDDLAAAREMTRYLLSLGHRRIAFIAGHPEQTVSAQRFLGYLQAMTEVDIQTTSDLVAQGFFTYRSGLQAGSLLLESAKPTAIFAANDEMAAAAVAVAHRKGMDVPKDLTVVGFDDTPLATMISPYLTTIRRPVAEMAARAVELLIDNVRSGRGNARKAFRRETVKYAMLIRDSSAGPRPGD